MIGLAAAVLSVACVTPATSSPSGLEIDCHGRACGWLVVEGTASFGPTWHEGDLGMDLSGSDRVVLEQKDVLISRHRELELRAALFRDSTVTLRFELDWYVAGLERGATFWDRKPVYLSSTVLPIFEEGGMPIHRDFIVPSEATGVIVRLIKDGSGRAMIDDLTVADPHGGK